MVPLPDPLKAQTIAAAAAIEAQTAQTLSGPPPPAPTTNGTTDAPTQNLTGRSQHRSGHQRHRDELGRRPPCRDAPGCHRSGAPVRRRTCRAWIRSRSPRRRTPSLPAPAVGALLLVVLIAGALAATSAPVTTLLGGGLRRRLRKEVTPTEQ